MKLEKNQFLHYRTFNPFTKNLDSRGGFTFFYRPDEYGCVISFAHCSPNDNFSKSRGRRISEGLMNSGNPENDHRVREYATQFSWEELHKVCENIIRERCEIQNERHFYDEDASCYKIFYKGTIENEA